MIKTRVTQYLLLVVLILINVFSVSSDTDAENVGGEKISLAVPKLSEEENESNHMPKHLRCDACLAVVHQIHSAFTKAKQRKSTLKESDIVDIVEDTCNNAFNEYGVKQVNNANRLSGPGLETEKVMGMTQMGGRWPHRLREMCHYYVGEAGEFDIYNAFSEGKKHLTQFLCKGKGTYGHCSTLKPAIKTEL